jgi:hypothetical protein
MRQNKPSSLPSLLLKFPALKRDLVLLFKEFGPWWMLTVLIVLTLPWTLASAGYFLTALAGFLRALRSIS